MKLEFSQQIFKNYSNTKFHEYPSSLSDAVPCRQMDGWPGMTKLIAAFHNFVNVPKNVNVANLYAQTGLNT
jgi:hypothetical protein